MKRFWLSLLSLGLVMAFSVSAFAVDVKVGAEYYVAGIYLSETNLADPGYDVSNSTAFFYQRLRVGTDFIVSPCLKLVTRFDAMERIWGGARNEDNWSSNVPPWGANPMSAGSRMENENIAFDVAYIDYTSPIGKFQVGYFEDYPWGTIWGNKTQGPTAGQIKFVTQAGPMILGIGYAKEKDKSYSSAAPFEYTTDRDFDSWRLFGSYPFNTSKAKGEVGVLYLYERDATAKPEGTYLPTLGMTGPGTPGSVAYKNAIDPYFKAKVGPVDLQGEFRYIWGKVKWEDGFNPGFGDVDISAYDLWLDATANFNMFYVGGSFAWLSGDDPSTSDELEGSANTAGYDYTPCLIMFNYKDLNYWAGNISSYTPYQVVDGQMANAIFFQVRGGVKPTAQTDVMLSVSYAKADEKPVYAADKDYGWEVDLTGTYKITNNLSYMLGVGYLFTGDYFKVPGGPDVNDDYLLINKLTLSF